MFSVKRHLAAIGYDDYEEAELLLSIERVVNKAAERLMNPQLNRKKALDAAGFEKQEAELLKSQVATLGYDPRTEMRPSRPRGRPRDDAMPSPLPPVGTELRSILGDTYTITAYLSTPRNKGLNLVVYQFGEDVVARNIANLFAGTMHNGQPIVTWPEDPRGLKPAVEVPLGKRRVLKKQDLKADRLARDADYQQDLESRRSGRRY